MSNCDLPTVEEIKRTIEIVQEGWCKGSLARWPNGVHVESNEHHYLATHHCVVGAYDRATNWEQDLTPFTQAFARKVGTNTVNFNDNPTTTKEDVIFVLRSIQHDLEGVNNDRTVLSRSS
jgi:hypothetical protein